MVASHRSTRSRLRESISTFVPLVFSHQSHPPHPPNLPHPLDNEFEYLGPAQRTGTDLSQLSTSTTTTTTEKPSLPTNNKMRPHPARTTTISTNSSHKPPRKPSHRTRTHHHKHPHPRAHPRPRRKPTSFTLLRTATESKLRLTLSFALATLTALTLYLGLFLSGTSSGITFHVLSILLIIALSMVATHSLLRFVALNRELKVERQRREKVRKGPRERGWVISRPMMRMEEGEAEKEGRGWEQEEREDPEAFPVFDDVRGHDGGAGQFEFDVEEGYGGREEMVERGVQGGDGVRYPPPVYGNVRDSIRLSTAQQGPVPPNTLVPPDPNITAPTPVLAPGMLGWHPPSFRSEGGITAVLERRRVEVAERLGGGGGVGAPAALLLGQGKYKPEIVGRGVRKGMI